MRHTLKQAVMECMEMTSQEADEAIAECRADLYERLARDEMPHDILEEYFGLEPDWLDELL